MKKRDLATAGMFGNRHDAEVARARLEASGVEAWVQSDDLGGYEPQLGLTNGVRVLVPTEFLAAANGILEPLEPAAPAAPRPWVALVATIVAGILAGMVLLPALITAWRWLT